MTEQTWAADPAGRDLTHREGDWAGLSVVVAGFGVSGYAAADSLMQVGARVRVLDGGDSEHLREQADILSVFDVDIVLGDEGQRLLTDPEGIASVLDDEQRPVDLVVTSPGWRPDQPFLAEAARRGLPVWGEVELAWRLRPREGAAPWLCVTGTNGKTTTVQMLQSMLQADGRRALAVGNVGTPLLEAIMDPEPYDVLAVELSSFQLHWSRSISPLASACLNIAPDHLDWHGGQEAYAQAKGRVYENTQVACIYNVEDSATEDLVKEADVVEGCRAVGFTLGTPGLSMVGLVDDVLADRAFVAERKTSATELATLADLEGIAGTPVPPHVLSNALAAAALARAAGVSQQAVGQGLKTFRADAHRMAEVLTHEGVRWVDDSKATNAHAARASLATYPGVVWIAGGLLKGASVDELVAGAAEQLRAVVLIGQDREVIAEALQRHAPDVPVVRVDPADTGDMPAFMDEVVSAASTRAQSGDVVLLAPAAASWDQFRSYGERGDLFADAVRRHAGVSSS